MEYNNKNQIKSSARDIAKILAYIKQQGYELSDYDLGKIDGLLTKSKLKPSNQNAQT